jgi:AsmA protein
MPDPRPRRRWQRVAGAALLVLVVLAVVGVFALDRILLRAARREAAALARDLGRPITLGNIETKLWGGLGVRVSDASIGPGEGEDRPLLELRRAEVSLALLRAALTRGKEIHVRGAVVEGLRLNVLKLADGTTNVERVARALEKKAKAAPAPEQPGEPARPGEPALRSLRVDRAAVENARVAFLDRTV